MIGALRHAEEPWDFAIVGGGATGLGCAVEAASRGYRAALLEQHDFAKGTSSRSTKLIHGGVRYLRQGSLALVLEALRERKLLLQNAPHLVHDLPFVVPSYDWWEGPFYGAGLKVYDLLAGRAGFARSHRLSREDVLRHLPTIEPEGLRGGVLYHDGQFDDARLAVNLAQTAAEHGAVLANYVEVVGLMKAGGEVTGVLALDHETGSEIEVHARAVINATGVWSDEIRRMDDPEASPMLALSQGAHIVLDRTFLPSDTAIMVPRTDGGRVLFAIPWLDRLVVGTTDTPVPTARLEPRPLEEELDFLLTHAGRYLVRNPTPADVRSAFAGLRPLVGAAGGGGTAALSREHLLHIAPSGLVTITGGKWTTYRRMAEDTIEQAAVIAGLPERPSVSRHLRIHGAAPRPEEASPLAAYGADASLLEALQRREPRLAERLHPQRPTTAAQVVWAARHEMARTVEDVLARRTRELVLDARASLEMAPRVAALLAEELGRDEAWQREQTEAYRALARAHLVG